MSKWATRKEALALLDRHPGWSDRRVASALGLSNSTVSRWRAEAGLPGYRKRVRDIRRRSELLAIHTDADDAATSALRRLAHRT